jgi:two-component system OmpR family response regulator
MSPLHFDRSTNPLRRCSGVHILVVDGDAQVRDLAAALLRGHGYSVSTASGRHSLHEKIYTKPAELAIVDIALPRGDGFDICRELRTEHSLPVIMLTRLGADADRLAGLEAGANDCLAKPFNPQDLLVMIERTLHRAQEAADTPKDAIRWLRFVGWSIDTWKRELTNPDGVIVDLSMGEYEILAIFLKHPQRVVSHDMLREQAAHFSPKGFDRAIDIVVSRLRKKLDRRGEEQPLIKSVEHAGYIFTADVTRA